MDWINILKESLPYLVPIVAIIIIAIMKKLGMTGYSPEQITKVINIVLKAIGWVEKNNNGGLKGFDKLALAKEIAVAEMGAKEKRILNKIGLKDERLNKKYKKGTFGDAMLAGVQNIFVNSASNLIQTQADKFIKKL